MVFCKECTRKGRSVRVSLIQFQFRAAGIRFKDRITGIQRGKSNSEIIYKNGQIWQLFGVPPSIYGELRHTTLDSFVKLIAQRYKVTPVKTRLQAIKVPAFESVRIAKQT